MSGFQRPHCQQPDACGAKSPTTHCRRCTMASLNRDGALNELRQKTRLANPATVATLRANCAKAGRDWRATADGRARMVEIARQNFSLTQTPEAAEKRRARAERAGIKLTLKRVPGLPEAGIPLYRELTRKRHVPPAEALRIVLDEIAREPERAKAAIALIDANMRAKEARRRRDAY